MKPLISVIVPVYNASSHLAACLDCILAQTEQRLEILLIDDGSTDSSRQIIAEYTGTHSFIRAFYLQHGGVSRARNCGLQAAQGEYIAFCDSDDGMDHRMLGVLAAGLAQTNAGLCCCGYKRCSSRSDPGKEDTGNGSIRILEADDRYRYVRKTGGYVWNKLFRRALLEDETPLRFREDIAVLEDEVFVYSYLERCRRICVIGDKLYYYVQHAKSVLHQSFSTASLTQVLAREVIFGMVASCTRDQYLKREIWNELIRTYAICYKKLLTTPVDNTPKWRGRICAGFHKYRGQYRLDSCWSVKERIYYLLLCVSLLRGQ